MPRFAKEKKRCYKVLGSVQKDKVIEFTLTGVAETGILGDSIGGGDFGRGANSRLSF